MHKQANVRISHGKEHVSNMLSGKHDSNMFLPAPRRANDINTHCTNIALINDALLQPCSTRALACCNG